MNIKKRDSRDWRRRRLNEQPWAKDMKSLATHCEYCKKAFDQSIFQLRRTMDHKIPMKDGGTDHPDNLAVVCWQCNHLKDRDTRK